MVKVGILGVLKGSRGGWDVGLGGCGVWVQEVVGYGVYGVVGKGILGGGGAGVLGWWVYGMGFLGAIR